MTGKRKTLTALIIITGVIVFIVSSVVLGVLIKSTLINRENKKAAETVMAHIEKLDDSVITLDSEMLIMSVKTEYDLLTDKQKSLVTNYPILQNALNDLQSLKDKKIADELINEIKRINKSTLTAEDTSVSTLLDKYNSLTDSQKSLVTNYNLLLEYKDIVDEKIEVKEMKEKGIALAENFEGYNGKWGDFGSHVNSYQGMIETVIREDINYKELFSTPVNSLDFNISRFEKNTTVFGIGISYFSFKGFDNDNHYLTLYGEIVIKTDGSVYAVVNGYY